MFYEFESLNGEKTTIDCSDEGTVVYTVGKRKTKFSLEDCTEYVFRFIDRTNKKIGNTDADKLFLIMMHGEERLERNNNYRETDEQWRFEAMTDSSEYSADNRHDTETDVQRQLDVENLRKAVQKLKPDEQELVHKLYLDEPVVSQAEYAKEIGVDAATMRKRAERVREKLKKLLR